MPNHIKAEALRDFIRLTKKGNSRKNKYDELLSSLGVRRLQPSSLSMKPPNLGI